MIQCYENGVIKVADKGKMALYLPYEFENVFAELSDEEVGKMVKAIMVYDRTGEEPNFDGILRFAWRTHIEPKMRIIKENYERKCKQNKENVNKRWKRGDTENKKNDTNDTNVNEQIPNDTNVDDIDIDRDIDVDIDRENNINNTNVLFDQQELVEQDKPKSEYSEIMEAWNRLPVTNIKAIKGTRLTMLKARLKDYTIDEILSAISNIRESPFLLGQNNKGWQITFDWFIRPNNFIKVYEGNYTGQRQTKSSTSWNDTQAGYNGVMERLGGIVDE